MFKIKLPNPRANIDHNAAGDIHQEIVETLVFPVRSDHVMDP